MSLLKDFSIKQKSRLFQEGLSLVHKLEEIKSLCSFKKNPVIN